MIVVEICDNTSSFIPNLSLDQTSPGFEKPMLLIATLLYCSCSDNVAPTICATAPPKLWPINCNSLIAFISRCCVI